MDGDEKQTARPKYRDPDWLRRQYVECGRTLRDIAAECDVHKSTIRRWLDKHDIPARDPNCAGHGVCCTIDSDGYQRVRVGDRTVGVHQLIALLKGTPPDLVFGVGGDYSVAAHHANGCPLDNRPCNIQPMEWLCHCTMHGHHDLDEFDVNAHCPLPPSYTNDTRYT